MAAPAKTPLHVRLPIESKDAADGRRKTGPRATHLRVRPAEGAVAALATGTRHRFFAGSVFWVEPKKGAVAIS